MKKMIFVLCFVIVFCCGVAAAEDIYEKPILFRGIQWGETYDNFIQIFPEGKEKWNFYPYKSGVNCLFLDKCEDGSQYNELGFGMTNRIGEFPENDVAGYSMNYIKSYFLYEPDENGMLVRDHEHGRFCAAFYSLKFNDDESTAAAWDDLTAKLTRLYGDVDETASEKKINVWRGADGTMVVLGVKKATNPFIEIRYSFEGMDELIQNAQAAVEHEFSLLTNGL